jgi:hypothetical protein
MKRLHFRPELLAFLACLTAACGETAAPAADAADAAPAADAGAPAPRAEVCGNGLDDDGNGRADDGCACREPSQRCFLGKPALAGVGACAWGAQPCGGSGDTATWGDCVGSGAPSAEICNGIDDDCNGTVDEGCACAPGATRACFGGPAGAETKGICKAGVQTCGSTGQWGACEGQVLPQASDPCNGVDDDCDGVVDQACECTPNATRACYTGPPNTRAVGDCKDGIATCVAESASVRKWGPCANEVLPTPSVVVATGQVNPSTPDLTEDGAGYALAWADGQNFRGADANLPRVHAARVDAGLAVTKSSLVATLTGRYVSAPALVRTGNDYSLFYTSFGASTVTHQARLDAALAVTSDASGCLAYAWQNAAWNGTKLGVASQHQACLAPTGAPASPLSVDVSAGASLTWSGAAWSFFGTRSVAVVGGFPVYGLTFSSHSDAGVASSVNADLLFEGDSTISPTAAWSGAHLGLGFIKVVGLNRVVGFRRVDAAGAFADPNTTELGNDASFEGLLATRWTGTRFVVASTCDSPGGNVCLYFIDAAGGLVGMKKVIACRDNIYGTKLAVRGGNVAVAWSHADTIRLAEVSDL